MSDYFDLAELRVKELSIANLIASEKDYDFLGEAAALEFPLETGHLKLSYELESDPEKHTDLLNYKESNKIVYQMLQALKNIWKANAQSLPAQLGATKYFIHIDPNTAAACLKSHVDSTILPVRLIVKKEFHQQHLKNIMTVKSKDIVDEILDLVMSQKLNTK